MGVRSGNSVAIRWILAVQSTCLEISDLKIPLCWLQSVVRCPAGSTGLLLVLVECCPEWAEGKFATFANMLRLPYYRQRSANQLFDLPALPRTHFCTWFDSIPCRIALIMAAVSTPETSVYFYQTTEHNIPEDCYLHACRENLRSHLPYPDSGGHVTVFLCWENSRPIFHYFLKCDTNPGMSVLVFWSLKTSCYFYLLYLRWSISNHTRAEFDLMTSACF